MEDENRYELALGDRCRSGGQWDIWTASFGPAAADGYPKPLWDKESGVIDAEVARYWRDNYDLRHRLQRDWKSLGPKLVGKLHIYCGRMDDYHLNNAVGLLQKFLELTRKPGYGPDYQGTVSFQEEAGHCWGPSTREVLELVEKHIHKYAPAGADKSSWRY